AAVGTEVIVGTHPTLPTRGREPGGAGRRADRLPKEHAMTDPAAEPRGTATAAALAFIREIEAYHPEILFHQSGGCDGASPVCYPADDDIVGDRDVKLGEIGGVPVYISESPWTRLPIE